MKTLNRYVPELAYQKINQSLENDPPMFKYEPEVFYFILDLFYRLKAYNYDIKYTSTGMIRISSKYFSKYITKFYSKYNNWLIKHKIIYCDYTKKEGKSYGYQVNPQYESKIIKVKILQNSIIGKRIIENYNKRKKYHKKFPEHIKIMKKHFKTNLKVDMIPAKVWLEEQLIKKEINITKYNVYLLTLYSIEDKEFFFHLNNNNGRIDSNITNIKSSLRKFIIGDLIHIDCKNSQPLLLNMILEFIKIKNSITSTTETTEYNSKFSHSHPSPAFLEDEIFKTLRKKLISSDLEYLSFFPRFSYKTLQEFEHFRHTTMRGNFYSDMEERYKNLYGTSVTRDELKVILYKVFFSKNTHFLSEKKIFKILYPTIYSIIKTLKEGKHNRLALCLQMIESEIFIQRICKRLVDAGIVPLTIHDSVIVKSSDKDKTLQIMSEVYSETLGDVPEFAWNKLQEQ